jgi:phytoene/squalene synthetase
MPKLNWRKVLQTGLDVGQMFLPRAVSEAIDAIEDNVAAMADGGRLGWDGQAKQEAALDTLLKSVAVAEGVAAKDLLVDERVAAAGRQAINAMHAQKVALAQFTEVIRAFKASKVPVAAADGTGQP